MMRPAAGGLNYESPKTELISFAFLLPYVSHGASRVRRASGPIRRPAASSGGTGAGRATDAGTTAATRRADRIVSGCIGGPDPRGGYLSRPSCGSRSVATAIYRS